MSETLDIRNLSVDSNGATFELYTGFGRWELMKFKKDDDRVGVIELPDYEDVIERYDLDDEVANDLEELVNGITNILFATLNITHEEVTE